MARRVGIGAIFKAQEEKKIYSEKGNVLAKQQLDELAKQYDLFRKHLEEFIEKHKKEITSNSEFRIQFLEMCTTLGVDPLISKEGMFDKLGLGTFYYVLAVQVIELCLAMNEKTGGVVQLSRLLTLLERQRSKKSTSLQYSRITTRDIKISVAKLSHLGSGFQIVEIAGIDYILSVPMELSNDHHVLLSLLSDGKPISVKQVERHTKWEPERVKERVQFLINNGIIWFDEVDCTYWPVAFHIVV
ncbi:hypothetical protein GJ496_009105 [Pomphorhynchus laevis]|nr:hypothetical protein GJ496_009320 [Pomphorhynchus laevis]KAI0989050.1 hypothetical protein GJ496_009105 [Pomphorhynchus laevis]